MSRIPILPLFLLAGLGSLHAQQKPPEILHEPIGCVGKGSYPVVDAVIQSASDIRAAKVYFRSDKYPKFYFVEMTREASGFRSVLPKPSRETSKIIYYIEAVDVAFNNTIGAENIAEVHDTCDERQTMAPGPLQEDPGIVVGATEAGAPRLPPGFEAVGIIGTLTSSGLLSGLGGGPGIGTAVAIGGAAAGAGGLAAAVSGSASATTTVPSAAAPGSTTTSAAVTSVPTTTTTTGGPNTPTSSTTTTSSAGATTTVPATTTSTTTPTTTTTTVASTPLVACFTFSDADGGAGCRVNFDGSCSTGDITNYEWRFQDNPPATRSGPSPMASYDWSSDPACGGPFSRLVKLTVTSSDNRTAETQTNINPNSPELTAATQAGATTLQTSFTSWLMSALEERTLAHVILNGTRIDITDNTTLYTHRLEGRHGWNTVEGVLASPSGQDAWWRFDFGGAAYFQPGSVRLDMGDAFSQDATSIVFRLSGTSGERIRFRYRLLPE